MGREWARAKGDDNQDASLSLGTGLTVVAPVLVPALVMRLGLGASLTGALSIALMKAFNRATSGKRQAFVASSARVG